MRNVLLCGILVFPIGTRFWKEFSYEGLRVEARYLQKRALRIRGRQPIAGVLTRSMLLRSQRESSEFGGTFEGRYEVSTAADCKRRHGGIKDNVLGFSTLLLDGDSEQGLTRSLLQADGRLPEPLSTTQWGGTNVGRAALVYLHVNCGLACHNSNPNVALTGFRIKLEVGRLSSSADIATYRTGRGMQSYIRRPGAEAPMPRIASGAPENSAVA